MPAPRPPATSPDDRGSALGRASALVRAAHAGPTVAVTLFALGYGVLGADLAAGRLALVVLAVLAGQLVIGWTNDWADAGVDAAAGRTDKPVAAGQVSRRAVGTAAAVAALACVVVSLLLGPAAAAVSLLVVACGVGYDLGLKGTLASPLPYAVAFGVLPAVATLAQRPAVWPPAAVCVAAGLLGVAAHLANTIPDAEEDERTGVRGLPQRLGPQVSALLAVLVITVAALVLLPGAVDGGGVRAVVATMLLGTGVLVAVLAGAQVLVTGWAGGPGPRHDRRAVGRSAFWLVVAAAALVVAGFLAS
ncbi:UbiA family prenyltransferase [Aquipuribacter hungaricus]|uniref:UbiA family prenyltransferase n=1 Tax=Aquipuribacter hungaricus TaxID=545624 RepID=A0ABV7WFP3_9MICO